MSETSTETGKSSALVQTALDMGVLSLEQADELLKAMDEGLVSDPLEWLVEQGLADDEIAARLREMVDFPDEGEQGSIPFQLETVSLDAIFSGAAASGSPSGDAGRRVASGTALHASAAVSSGDSPSPEATTEPGTVKAMESARRGPVAPADDSRPGDATGASQADAVTAPETLEQAGAADIAEADSEDALADDDPVFGVSGARETTSPENLRMRPASPVHFPADGSDVRSSEDEEAARAAFKAEAFPDGQPEPSTRTGRPPKAARTRTRQPSSPSSSPGPERHTLGAASTVAEPGGEGLATEQPGRYTFRYLHASGGQARILLVHDEQIGRDVALKEVSLDEVHSAEERPGTKSSLTSAEMQRLLREARVTGQLEHPNIVPVYDLGRRKDGALYYTMRFVRGVTLSQRLKACKTLAERLRLLKPFLDICNAIAYAHSRGVIHRDLKPANAMVGEFGETVLLDWGIAKVRHMAEIRNIDTSNEAKLLQEKNLANTIAGEAIGTPGYMSPEQALGMVDQVDERSDVFGLGAILYQVLTGAPPYKGGSEEELLDRARRCRFVPVLRAEPSAPRPLAAIAEKALSKLPDDRYQSAKELAEEIDSYMTGGKVGAYSYTSKELLFRFAQRHKLLLVSVSLLFAAICTSLVAVSMSLKHQQQANVALGQAQEQEHAERLAANLNLAAMHAMDAGRFIALQRFASAEKSALLSLRHNPAHPKSSFYTPGDFSWSARGRYLRVLAASALYQARLRNFSAVVWSFLGGEAMTAPAFSPDGKRLAVGSYDARVRILDIGTGSLLAALPGHSSRINSVAFSSDGRFLASAAQETGIIVRDAASGAMLFTLQGHRRPVRSVTFSEDGSTLLSASLDGTVRLWDMETRKLIRTIAVGTDERIEVNAAIFAEHDTAILAGCADGSLRRIPIADAKAAEDGGRPDNWSILYRRPGEIWSLAKPQDGEGDQVLLSGRTEKSVIQLNQDAYPSLTLEGHANGISTVAYSPGDTVIASSSYDGTVRLWGGLSGMPLLTLEGHSDFVSGVAFSPRARFLASTSFDKSVHLWRLTKSHLPQLFGHTEPIHGLAFSPNGKLIASGSWDKTVRVWDARTGKVERILRGHQSNLIDVVFSDDSSKVVSSARDGHARIWDVETGKLLLKVANPDNAEIESIALSPDGSLLATGSAIVGNVYLWDASTGKLLNTFEGHQGVVSGLLFSRDGRRLATCGRDKSIIVYDMDSRRQAVRLTGGHGDWISDLAWGDSEERTLYSSGKDGLIIKWDLESGREIARVVAHEQWVNSIRISRSGRLLASASDDKTVRVWDTQTGDLLLIINTVAEATSISFSVDEKTLAVGDGTILLLYPLDFSTLDEDPNATLADSGQVRAIVPPSQNEGSLP